MVARDARRSRADRALDAELRRSPLPLRPLGEDQPVELGWAEVRARRLARSSLRERAGGDRLVEVASAVCGVHAQVETAAELQLAARVDGVTQADVRAALWEQRSLVKAWTLRGTLHLHPAGELPLWLAARRAVLASADQGLPAWPDPPGVVHPALGADEVAAVRAAVWEALDGRCLLRDELADAVVEARGADARARLRSGFAFFLSDLCQGPPQGRGSRSCGRTSGSQAGQRWTSARRCGRSAGRFLRTYGPARPVDFFEWFGTAAFRMAEARALFDELGGRAGRRSAGTVARTSSSRATGGSRR